MRTYCDNCREPVERKPSVLDKTNNVFCDKECERDYHYIEVVCLECRDEFEKKRSDHQRSKSHFCSDKCRKKWFEQGGEKAPNWKGGKKHYQYYGPDWRRVREKILKRDEYKCKVCGDSRKRKMLDIHHIEPLKNFSDFEEANKKSNLITLCKSCHNGVEKQGYLNKSELNESI